MKEEEIKNIMKEIEKWIVKQQNNNDFRDFIYSSTESFGFVELFNGEKAQVQVNLETEKDEWMEEDGE